MKYADGAMIAIAVIAAENEFCDNMYHRSEPDWLICSKPPAYVPFVPAGDLEEDLQGTPAHRLMEERNIAAVQRSFMNACNHMQRRWKKLDSSTALLVFLLM